MEQHLQAWAKRRGYRVAWGPAEVVGGATAEIDERMARGELDAEFFASELAPAVAAGKQPMSGTVVVVAVPRPAHLVRFELDDGPFATLLPPTYVHYRSVFEDVRRELEREALPGYRVEHLTAPLKATAARLGLVRHGRNNVTYAEGFGSYMQLCGFLTDAPLPVDESAVRGELTLLDECEGCGACIGVCPTGAVNDERVLLSAHRCLTYANETPGEWPEWVPQWGHSCLLGCLECQKVCPVNPQLPVEDTGLVFSAAETRALLADGGAGDEFAESGVRNKLAWLGRTYTEPVLGRNLRALVAAGATLDEATVGNATSPSTDAPALAVEADEPERACGTVPDPATRVPARLIREGLVLV